MPGATPSPVTRLTCRNGGSAAPAGRRPDSGPAAGSPGRCPLRVLRQARGGRRDPASRSLEGDGLPDFTARACRTADDTGGPAVSGTAGRFNARAVETAR
ncbi:hypothetical protein GCM10022416_25410 [Actinomadura keratinilytica]|uniref:Uncharacterized protein n=1 Tax=Actinomadura keratinilytica TaxID=547461 RepID=A0ABP7YPG0_9ACTN